MDNNFPWASPCKARLIALENYLRMDSEGQLALNDYVAYIEANNLEIPSRRTLHEDLSRYRAYCDDIVYGGDSKVMKINRFASDDAVKWFLGHAWLGSKLRPSISSSACRSLLLAEHDKAEVEFFYKPLRTPNEPWIPSRMSGVPLHPLPGADSAYYALMDSSTSTPIALNIARIQGPVTRTGLDMKKSPMVSPEVMLTVTFDSRPLMEHFLCQFSGFKAIAPNTVGIVLERVEAVLMANIIESYLKRTQKNRETSGVVTIGQARLSMEAMSQETARGNENV